MSACISSLASSTEPILLCAGGSSAYQIVIADDATVYEKKAAKLLQLHLLKLADAYLPIVGESAPAREDIHLLPWDFGIPLRCR